MTFDGTCERGGVQRAPQETEERSPGPKGLELIPCRWRRRGWGLGLGSGVWGPRDLKAYPHAPCARANKPTLCLEKTRKFRSADCQGIKAENTEMGVGHLNKCYWRYSIKSAKPRTSRAPPPPPNKRNGTFPRFDLNPRVPIYPDS
jgi:hypothetical protein